MTREKSGGLRGLLVGSDAADDDAEPESAADIEGGKRDAAQRVLQAVKADDAEALTVALTDFHALCSEENY